MKTTGKVFRFEDDINTDYIISSKNMIPLGRIAEPEDMVGTAIFLASKASDFVTGQTVLVDGGYTIW